MTIPLNEKIWKRWHDPDRLLNEKNFNISSDIYSLGLLFWEIAWCEPDKLPFKGIKIKLLYQHLQNYHKEELPKVPHHYRRWKSTTEEMLKFKPEDRHDLKHVETTIKKLLEGRIDSGITTSGTNS